MWKRRMAPAEESRLHNGKQCVRCCPRHRSCRFLISLFLPLLLIRLLIFGSFLASPFIYITYSFWFFLLRIRCISKSAPPCGMTYPSNIDIHPFSIRTSMSSVLYLCELLHRNISKLAWTTMKLCLKISKFKRSLILSSANIITIFLSVHGIKKPVCVHI